jgi:hypothetical protein
MSTESSVGDSRVRSARALPEVARLAAAVQRLLVEWEEWRERAVAAESRYQELERALHDLATGNVDPVALTNRVHALEQENRFLARRLDRARESVRRISARLQFLDEDR